ncbi:MAG TPA: hypothetical protein VFC63_24825 [Blastocatellia bacterium]|nr:hypothetical protein [Blastocatellia bacterium]
MSNHAEPRPATTEIPQTDAFGNQPILSGIEISNQILNANLQQQATVHYQQAIFNLHLATVAKSIEVIMAIDPASPQAIEQLKMCRELVDSLREQYTPRTNR